METSANTDPDDSIDTAGLAGHLRSTVGRLYRRFRSERPEGSLGDKALEVITWLQKTGPQTLTRLSDVDGVAPASMSQVVNRLTSAGYVVRMPDPSDRRKVLFGTTPDGAALATQVRAQRNEWLESRLSSLSAHEREVIASACALLSELAGS
jgi:DNA-binding MarR family transcriptional regulator